MTEEATPEIVEPAEDVQIDQRKLERLLYEIELKQNLGLGIVGGLAAALVGAAVWAVVTIVTNFQIGWMAVGVGFLVGYAVRLCGKGIKKIYGIIGAVFALVGCLLGNFLSVCSMLAKEEGMAFFELLSRLNPAAIPELMTATFHPMDLLFYGIAVYEGYKFSFLQVSPEALSGLVETGD